MDGTTGVVKVCSGDPSAKNVTDVDDQSKRYSWNVAVGSKGSKTVRKFDVCEASEPAAREEGDCSTRCTG